MADWIHKYPRVQALLQVEEDEILDYLTDRLQGDGDAAPMASIAEAWGDLLGETYPSYEG